MKRIFWSNLYGLTVLTGMIFIASATGIKHIVELANYASDWAFLLSLTMCVGVIGICVWLMTKIVKQVSLIIKNKYNVQSTIQPNEGSNTNRKQENDQDTGNSSGSNNTDTDTQ